MEKKKKEEEDKFAWRGVILKHDTNLTNILKKQTQLRIDT